MINQKIKDAIENGYLDDSVCVNPDGYFVTVEVKLRIPKSFMHQVHTRQIEKGLKKYGKTIDDCEPDEHPWELMAIEEMIDLLAYYFKNKQQ